MAAVPAAARKALPTVGSTVLVAGAAVWQRDAVLTGVHALMGADPRWLVVAGLATLALWPTSVFMLRGSIPSRTDARQLFALQLAVPAIGLVPAASLLLRLRFLRRTGLSHTGAMASMALMGFAALMVRVPLVIIAALAAPSLMSRHGAEPPWHDLGGRASTRWHHLVGENPWRTAGIMIIAVVVGAAVLAAIVVAVNRRVQGEGGWRRLPARIRHARSDAEVAWKSVAATAVRPRRAAALWICALLQPLLMVVALWAVLHAVGADLSLPDTFVVELVTVALAPLLPSPNGVATKEITIAAGLTAVAGLTAGVAVGVALGYRLLTFWCQIPLGLASFAYLNHRRAI
ncbi:lysylphosphatidylglycerol synthase transmembrane domain-containing protein [Nocardia sp. CDC160]|uniref:lysylphosphatidylglycerol synthase transmembrane domain-containing protein n=1 Tax=Nocardia sp. CDC160 TaxID=3112166 RepID=UPI002DBF9E6D|nr:YbhN family protein [Nocardia sp. CDC160]MEC3914615.1 YbhN family protein [Nocardia sp. CDC160]